jgi:hypothetical protein
VVAVVLMMVKGIVHMTEGKVGSENRLEELEWVGEGE